MNTICFYHKADNDGLMCREVIRLFRPEAKFVGYDYGEPIPTVDDAGNVLPNLDTPEVWEIFICDISIPELMCKESLKRKIVWIDHHVSAIEKYEELNLKGLRIDGVAACRLTFAWFMHAKAKPDKEEFVNRTLPYAEPPILTLLGEYDVWDKRDKDAERLNIAMQALTGTGYIDVAQRALVHNLDLDPLLITGQKILDYLQVRNARIAEYANCIRWCDMNCLVLNGHGNSQVFDSLDHQGIQALVLWRCAEEKVIVSLYHPKDDKSVDLSKIAKAFGGGGHKGACGFTIPLADWLRHGPFSTVTKSLMAYPAL